MPDVTLTLDLQTATTAGAGTAWSVPTSPGGNAAVSVAPGSPSNDLVLNTGPIALPAGATINGFTIELTRDAAGFGQAQDLLIGFELSSGAQSANLALAANWPGSPAAQGYGGPADRCGLTAANATRDAVAGGVTLSFSVQAVASMVAAHIDAVTFTVTYGGGSPPPAHVDSPFILTHMLRRWLGRLFGGERLEMVLGKRLDFRGRVPARA